MANYLITGARAPVVLDIARCLGQHGHLVYVTDPWQYPIGSQSKWVLACLQTAEPVSQTQQYINDLNEIIRTYQIDYILPTCEEIFYLAKHRKDLDNNCQLLADSMTKLESFHSKHKILSAASGCGITLPHTLYIRSSSDIPRDINYEMHVLKPEYCRFGLSVITELSKHKLERWIHDNPSGGLLQQKITGTEYCTFSIAHHGHLTTHITYRPKYRLQHSASFYFEPVQHNHIKHFVEKFIQKHHFSGAIAFDIIESATGQLYLIECNPRVSSGIHCLPAIDLAAAYHGKAQLDHPQQSAMLGYAMWLTGALPAVLNHKHSQWYKDCKQARDPICVDNDKPIRTYKLKVFGELLLKMLKKRKGFKTVSIMDIEYAVHPGG